MRIAPSRTDILDSDTFPLSIDLRYVGITAAHQPLGDYTDEDIYSLAGTNNSPCAKNRADSLAVGSTVASYDYKKLGNYSAKIL